MSAPARAAVGIEAAHDPTRGGGRLLVAQPGMLADPDLRAILAAAGWRLDLGGGGVLRVGVWGRRPWSAPGLALARATGLSVLTAEDGPLRAIRPGGAGGPPASLLLDDIGAAVDAAGPSVIERLVERGAGEAPGLRARARAGVERLRALGLSKYSPVARGAARVPRPGYVLVVDQVRGDASVALGRASAATFHAMLAAARVENPGAPIVVKTHPAASDGRRRGHIAPADLRPGETLLTEANPWDAVEGAAKVYAVTSQLGYEAVLAGVETHVFGLPFYAGWGLTRDRLVCPRRRARPSREGLFAITHLIAPLWWDPHARTLTDFETAVEILSERAAAERRTGTVVHVGVAPWKRAALARFAPAERVIAATRDANAGLARAARTGARLQVWASRAPDDLRERAARSGVALTLVEDGFLRSVGLGARLSDPASLVFDDLGIHFDPRRPSRLEMLIEEAAGLAREDPHLARAAALRARLRRTGVTKYNLGGRLPSLPPGARVVVVAGQVADDASLRLGATGAVRDNLALLRAARAAEPDAFLVYRPHPDVAAGLRMGRVAPAEAAALADAVAPDVSLDALLARADALWTLTSTAGFEALIRGVPVTCLGVPFYAGWGLTRDLGPVPARRRARPSLDALVWAALIAYPAYVDPRSGLATGPERLVERLGEGVASPRGGPWRRVMALAQDALGRAGLVVWR